MEELIEKLSKGKTQILFLVGLSDDHPLPSQHTVSHIRQIQQCCPKVNVIFFQNHPNCILDRDDVLIDKDDDNEQTSNDNNNNNNNSKKNNNLTDEVSSFDHSSMMNMDTNNREHIIDSNQSSTSSILHDWLKASQLIFMIDMFFSVSTSSGELSNTTHTILQYVSTCLQSELQIFCLHSVSMLYHHQHHHHQHQLQTGSRKSSKHNKELNNNNNNNHSNHQHHHSNNNSNNHHHSRSLQSNHASNNNDNNDNNHNKGITNLMNAFQDVSIIHMVNL